MIIAICDDQKYICDKIEKYCREHFEKKQEKCKIDCFYSGEEFLESDICPDILFLDIELGGLSGLDVAHRLGEIGNKNTYIVYITSYVTYMEQAFDINVLGFLEKPITDIKISRVIEKALQRKSDWICVYNRGAQPICARDILYIQAEASYSRLVLVDGAEFLERKQLKKWEAEIGKLGFFRIHQSWLINFRHVTKYDIQKQMVSVGGQMIKIPRRRRKEFEEALRNFKLKRN